MRLNGKIGHQINLDAPTLNGIESSVGGKRGQKERKGVGAGRRESSEWPEGKKRWKNENKRN
jgi:hypothetical protein